MSSIQNKIWQNYTIFIRMQSMLRLPSADSCRVHAREIGSPARAIDRPSPGGGDYRS